MQRSFVASGDSGRRLAARHPLFTAAVLAAFAIPAAADLRTPAPAPEPDPDGYALREHERSRLTLSFSP